MKRKTKEPTGILRLIGYCRVSTEGQVDDGVSLEAQQEKLRQYIATYADKFELINIVVDAGVSAKTLDRPGIQKVLEALQDGLADGILVVKLDRLTRNVRDLGELIETYFNEDGRILVSVHEHIDTSSAGGRFMLNILGSISQWERETIGERTRDALSHLQNKGVRLGSAGLGWTHGDETELDSEGRRTIKNVEAEYTTIDRIVSLRADGKSLRKIAAQLNAEGRKTKRGGRWQAQTIANVLLRKEN